MNYKTQVIYQWLKYTPYFFYNAPIKHWYKYFNSCYRVSTSVAYCKEELNKLTDNRSKSIFLYGCLKIIDESKNK